MPQGRWELQGEKHNAKTLVRRNGEMDSKGTGGRETRYRKVFPQVRRDRKETIRSGGFI